MLRAALILTVAGLLLALATAASQAQADQGNEQIDRWLATSKMPLPPELRVISEPCPGTPDGIPAEFVGGCTFPLPEAPIYLRLADKWLLFHEIGHRFQYDVMSQGEVNRFGSIMHYKRVDEMDERLADAYASCAFGERAPARRSASAKFPTGNEYWPTGHEQRQVCGLLTRSARSSR